MYVCRGVKQGYPTSGLLWAVLIDPIVTQLAAVAGTIFHSSLAAHLAACTTKCAGPIGVYVYMYM